MGVGQGETGRRRRRVVFLWRLLCVAAIPLLYAAFASGQARAKPSQITEFDLGLSGPKVPDDLLVGPRGDLWFTVNEDHAVGRLSADGSVEMFTTGPDRGVPTALAVGPEGDIWVGLDENDRSDSVAAIGRIEAGKGITRVAGLRSGTSPGVLAVDPRGAVWFASTNGSRPSIGRVGMSGERSQFDLRDYPSDLVVGPDGSAWFSYGTAETVGKFGKATPHPDGSMTITFSRNGLRDHSRPDKLFNGRDGAIWFTDPGEGTVGRLDASDGAAELLRPGMDTGYDRIALGPYGRRDLAGSTE